ncbi:MAG: hypothetical protein ACYTFT_11450 [Planctomycetota bacterium]
MHVETLKFAPADLTLTDPAGESFRLADRWRDRSLVLVFLRHFG